MRGPAAAGSGGPGRTARRGRAPARRIACARAARHPAHTTRHAPRYDHTLPPVPTFKKPFVLFTSRYQTKRTVFFV